MITKLNIFILLILSLSSTLISSEVIWNKPTNWNNGLPASIQVFQTNSSFTSNINMTASYCKIDLSDPDLEFRVVHADKGKLKTPSEFIQDEPNLVYMIANGGYFNMTTNETISLVLEDGKVFGSQSDILYEPYKNYSIPYYPTAGAFGIYKDKTPEITWTYSINNNISDIYSYPQPSENCFNCPPKLVPNAIFPHGGAPWTVEYGIGGGPVLIKDGKLYVTIQEELIKDEIAAQRNPRTSICITKDQKVITMIVDGRYELSGGLFLEELAKLMLDLECENALNLDGGGSSAMIVNGYLTNRPSDAQGQRPVPSAIMVVSKTKKKNSEIIHI